MLYLFLALIVVSLLFYLRYRISNQSHRLDLETVIDQEAQKYLKSSKTTAVVIGIYKDGKSVYKSYGTDAPNEHSIFQIGSVTKVFNALLLQTLCDEGSIHLEQSLDELIGSETELSAEAKNITLKQLVTHTAGFPRVPNVLLQTIIDEAGKQEVLTNPYSHIDINNVFSYLANTSENHKAGKFVYSNYGMGLLGHVLEKAMNTPYEVLLKEKVLTPLNMQNTSIQLTLNMKEALIQGYTIKGKTTPIWTFNALAGAGALNSNSEDMLKFISAAVNKNSPIFKAFESTRQVQCKGDTGLGWLQPGFLDKFFGNKDIVWHSGMVGGYVSYLSIDHKAQYGVTVLANKAADATMLGLMLTAKTKTHQWMKKTISKP